MNIRARVRARRSEEEGFALLDVAIAIVVLMIVLLPIAYLLSTTAKTAATNQHRLTAQSIAASWLSQEQSAGEQSASAPPPVDNPTGTASTSWPSSPLVPTPDPVGTTTYEVFMAAGWCAYAGPGVPWADGTASTSTPGSPAPPLTYFVAVKVKWGPNASNPNLTTLNDGSVVEYSSVQSQPSWNVTLSPSNALVSPLTLTQTTNIVAPEANSPNTLNICPLGLK